MKHNAVFFAERPLEMVSVPKDVSCVEKEEATFTCELNKPNIPVKWLKNGQELHPDLGYKVLSEGNKHTLTIPKAKLDDAATFTVVAADLKADCQLTVDGKDGLPV